MEIEELHKDIKEAETKIRDILRGLDGRYAPLKEMPVRGVTIWRWNGSNELSGPISRVKIDLIIC